MAMTRQISSPRVSMVHLIYFSQNDLRDKNLEISSDQLGGIKFSCHPGYHC